MPNCFTSALVGLLCAAGLSAQDPSRDDGRFSVLSPVGHQVGQWGPVVMLWWPGSAKAREDMSQALVERGFSVVALLGTPDATELGGVLADVRKRLRISQGGIHAVIASGQDKSVSSLLTHGHEFQTVTLFGDASGADLSPLQKLRNRRIRAMAKADTTEVCEHLQALHQQRVVAGEKGQVHQTLDSFHDAAAVADEDRYFAIMPEDAVFLGTDATERWTGKEFRVFAMRYFKLESAWTYVPHQRYVTLSPDGKVAWFDEVLDNGGYGECRGTGVLVKRNGSWALLQYNLTVPVPNDLMAGVAKQIREHLGGTEKNRK